MWRRQMWTNICCVLYKSASSDFSLFSNWLSSLTKTWPPNIQKTELWRRQIWTGVPALGSMSPHIYVVFSLAGIIWLFLGWMLDDSDSLDLKQSWQWKSNTLSYLITCRTQWLEFQPIQILKMVLFMSWTQSKMPGNSNQPWSVILSSSYSS